MPKGIYNRTISKIRQKHSEETKLKMSLAKKGRVFTLEHKEKLRQAKLGTKQTEQHIKNRGLYNTHPGYMLGKHQSEKQKKIISERMSGSNNPGWKGGISKDVHSTSEPKYKEWRMKVFMRDGFRCKMCNSKDKLQAHHILRWADFIELRYDINNGITLCITHHPRKKVDEQKLSPYFRELILQ